MMMYLDASRWRLGGLLLLLWLKLDHLEMNCIKSIIIIVTMNVPEAVTAVDQH